MSATLILASASPRRSELLTQLGVDFRVHPADIDESVLKGESPGDYVERMAHEKAEAVAGLYPEGDYAILAADTTVVIDGDVLGSPAIISMGWPCWPGSVAEPMRLLPRFAWLVPAKLLVPRLPPGSSSPV